MTPYLVTDDNPTGRRLEEVLTDLRHEVLQRCVRVALDTRPEARKVLANNVRVLEHLTGAIALAEENSKTLNLAFGPSKAAEGGPPRIGVR